VFDRRGVFPGKILFVENTGSISSTKAENDSPKAPKIHRTVGEVDKRESRNACTRS